MSNQLVVCAAVLWWSCASASNVFPAEVGQVTSATNAATDGLSSLADISRIIEAQGMLLSSGAPFDFLDAWMAGDDGGDPVEGIRYNLQTHIFQLDNKTVRWVIKVNRKR